MKLTVVGFWGGYPARDGATSAYLLEKDDFSLLIDAGSGSLSKLQKYIDINKLDAVIISHYHTDHVADIGVIQHAKLINYHVDGVDTVLPIYGHREDEEGFAGLTHQYTKGFSYTGDEILEIGPFKIEFQKSIHPVPCYGMRVTDGQSTVTYTADTAYSEEWGPFAENSDLLITDTNYYAGMDGSKAGHMNCEEAAQIAESAGVGKLLLSHLPQFGNHQELKASAQKVFKGEVILAEEGFIWEE